MRMAMGVRRVREVDLHGMKTAQALEAFALAYDNTLRESPRGGALKVIHGHGSGGAGGDTRNAIRSWLKASSHSLKWIAGEEIDGNPGYTVVYPERRLSQGAARIHDSIVEFCSRERTQSDVIGRFVRRNSESDIANALRELETRGRLRTFVRNGRKYFIASSR